MIGFIDLTDSEAKIEENLEKIRQKRCDSHNKYKAAYFCTNVSCIKNSTSFLCGLCYDNHSKNHLNNKEIKSIEDLFSTKRLSQIKEDSKIDSSHEVKLKQILQDLDEKFGKLKESFNSIIDEECKKVKANIKEKYSVNNEYIIKIIKEHDQILHNLFTKNEIMNNFKTAINPYIESFDKISEAFRTQSKIVENRYKNINLFMNKFAKINEKHKDLVDYVQQKISNFDELYNNINSMDKIQPVAIDDILLQKLKTSKIVKKIPILHNDIIHQIIGYGNNTKYITCSVDKGIIIRNR